MFNKSKIDSLFGIVGWRSPDNPDYQILDAANLASTSGRFVNDNAYAKVELVKDNQDYAGQSNAEFNTKLKELQETSISSVCSAVFNDSDYIDRQVFYRYAQNKTNTETLPNGFIGYKLTIDDAKDVAFNISRILLDFDGTGDIELMLFNTAKKEVVFSQVVSITTDHQEVELNWTLDDTDSIYKGDYYLGYNTDSLTVQPFTRDYNQSSILSSIVGLGVENVFVSGHNTNTLFDLNDVDGNSQTTGLNPDITVFKDYTDLILNNKSLLSYAILLDLQIRCISLNLSSIRSSNDQRRGNDMTVAMLQTIEGQNSEGSVKITGLRPMLSGEIKRLVNVIKELKEGYFGGTIRTYTAQ